MEPSTLKALKASIEHWKRLEAGETGERIGADNCPLCGLFWDLCCVGCPVRNQTHQRWCKDTPYDRVDEVVDVYGYGSKEFRLVATKEREFLESLLPKKQARKEKKP